MPIREAKIIAESLLVRLKMLSVANKRNSDITPKERFCTMILRAAIVRDAVLVLDKPFTILEDLMDGYFIMNVLRKVDDLIAEAHIFDYTWEKSRYGREDGTES
jgi:ABC-type molybdenum transport system ATPase subunit/photorepair protein PhrA